MAIPLRNPFPGVWNGPSTSARDQDWLNICTDHLFLFTTFYLWRHLLSFQIRRCLICRICTPCTVFKLSWIWTMMSRSSTSFEVQCQIWQVHNTIKHLYVFPASGSHMFCFGKHLHSLYMFLFWPEKGNGTFVLDDLDHRCEPQAFRLCRQRLGRWWLCFQSPQVPNAFGDVARNSGFAV